jgi:hypothetical protein
MAEKKSGQLHHRRLPGGLDNVPRTAGGTAQGGERQLRIHNLAAEDKLITEARENGVRRRALQRCAGARRELTSQSNGFSEPQPLRGAAPYTAAAARTAPQESLALLPNIGSEWFVPAPPGASWMMARPTAGF